MSFIINTSTIQIDVTADSLLSVLEKSNIAEDIVRRAGLESADMCLCPAVKLARNVLIMETHDISLPEAITKKGTAKTLSDLPYELLTQCYDLLVCELRQETDEGTDEFYSEELKIPELCSPREDIFDLYIRHLFLSALSANRYLRQFAIAEFLRRVQLDPLYTKYFSSASFEEEPTHQGTVDQTDHQKHVLTWRSLFNWLGHVEFFFSPCKMLHDTAILDLIGSVKVILPLEQHEAFRGFGVTTEENGMLILEPRKNELEDYCHVHCGKPSYGPTSTSEVERLLLYKLRIDYRGGA